MSLLLLFHPRVAANADTATVYLDLQPISVEEFIRADDATVYLNLQPGSIFLQVDSILEITGVTARWVAAAPLTRWIIPGQLVLRWRAVEEFARWAMLETRRLFWKS